MVAGYSHPDEPRPRRIDTEGGDGRARRPSPQVAAAREAGCTRAAQRASGAAGSALPTRPQRIDLAAGTVQASSRSFAFSAVAARVYGTPADALGLRWPPFLLTLP
ncbi:hypothetical protein ACRAWF_45685 [Streptomyces sp. L7]